MPVDTILFTQVRGGGERIAEFPADGVKYGFRLNRPGAISFALSLDHSKTVQGNIEEGVHEVGVERAKTEAWVGPILTADEDDKANTLQIGGEGLMAYLRRMHITDTLTFSVSTDDQFDIARALIEHHQNKGGGDFGIDTTAVTTSGRKRDHTYQKEAQKNIYDAIVELSEVNDGFDFNFNPLTREFDLFYPNRGRRRTDIVFDQRNIRGFRRKRDATGQGSHLIGKFSDDLIINAQDSGAVAKYGLTQRVIVHKDVPDLTTGVDLVLDAEKAYKNVPNLISLTVDIVDPQLFTYGLGDEVRIDWPSKYNPVNEFQRLIGFDVVWTKAKEEAVLYLEPLSTARPQQFPETTSDAERRLAILEGFIRQRHLEGFGTIAAGNSTVDITHGLGITPSTVFLTPQNDESIWSTAFGPTTFTVNRSGTGSAVIFSWLAIP